MTRAGVSSYRLICPAPCSRTTFTFAARETGIERSQPVIRWCLSLTNTDRMATTTKLCGLNDAPACRRHRRSNLR